jgi:hypothetical protein
MIHALKSVPNALLVKTDIAETWARPSTTRCCDNDLLLVR